MFERRSLKLPITLGVIMIVVVVLLTVGWVILSIIGAFSDFQRAGWYWTLLSVGATLLGFELVGVVMYLTLSIKAINLSRRQSNFIDSVTHELKSPIASLKLYLQTLNRRSVSAEEQASFYRFMLEDVERLDNLINHLLDAARLDKLIAPGEEEEVDLAALLQNCIRAVAQRHAVPPETFDAQLKPVLVRARPVDLELIFRNLIDNAVKYGGTPPQVSIQMHREKPDLLVVQISDNGRGIPAHQRWRLFGRFIRLGSELEREKPGTGLGLYIVRTLVTRLKGKIHLRDSESGPGSTFEVTLRCLPEQVD